MDKIRFSHDYKDFTALLNDVNRIIAHYGKYKFIVGYDIYPQTLHVSYEVSKERQGI